MTQVLQAEKDDGRIGPGRIRDLYLKGVKATNSETQRYWENVAFLQGEQWVFWSKTRNRLEDVPRDDSRVRATVNRLASTKRRLLAKALKKPLVFEVPPTGADDATIQGARIAEAILGDLRRTQDWESLREELTIAAFDGGTGLLCLDWDAEAGEELERTEDGKTVGTGECRLTVLAITEGVSEPGTKDIERARWWIKAQALPAKEVQATYRLEQSPAADASAALSPVQRKILATDRAYRPEDLCLVLTYYERPSKENPKGQVCVVVGDKTVDGPHPWPFPFDDHLNVTVARETKVLGRWTGDTILSQAVPVQTLLNQVVSSIVEHRKLASNLRVLWPDFAGDAVDSLTDLPGEIVSYMPTQQGVKPEWWAPDTSASNQGMQEVQWLEGEIDNILGDTDVSRGEAPRNIESGSGLAILAEASETPVAKLATEVADAFARAGSWALECYQEYVDESRDARVDYPHQVSETVQWRGQDLQGQTRAIVPENAVLPVSEAEVWTKAVNLYDRGMFDNPDGTKNRLAFAQFVSSSGEADFVEATDPDVAKAKRENYRLALGEPMEPALWDDHAKHIEVHNIYRKSASYERLDPLLQELFDLHVTAHQTLAAENAAAAANLQLQDVGTGHLAGLPTADEVNGAPVTPVDQNGGGGAMAAPMGPPSDMGEMGAGEAL